MNSEASTFKRQATAMERLFTRSPFSLVTVVARVAGNVAEDAFRSAIAKVQQRHVNLRVRLIDDEDGNPWLTTEGAGGVSVDVIERHSADDWIDIARQTARVPFDFEERPPIRFVLVRSEEVSELLIVCHHILCDGMSLAYLARDLLEHLGDPTLAVTELPDPTPIDLDTMPDGIGVNGLVRFVLRRINKKWESDPVLFDQDDYELLHEAYWAKYDHQLESVELSDTETKELVERCRRNDVTVNTALTAAFATAQLSVLGEGRYHPGLGVAADLRGRLRQPVGEVMGFYAGVATPKFIPDLKVGFWQNAKKLHEDLQKGYTNDVLFKDPFLWNHLSPAILDAINFKKLGGLVSENAPGATKLREFGGRKDVVLDILRRDKMESPDRVFMGTAVTNLTRLDFPTSYGRLELERLVMKPGGAFPLANVNLVVGVATVADRLSMAIEYVENSITRAEMASITAQVHDLLLG